MKKNFRFLICLATAAVAASCLGEKEMDNGPQAQLVPMTFSAVVDDIVDDTKTSLGTDFSVIWDEEESISLLSGSSHTEFSMVGRSDDGKTAVFEGLAEQTGVYYAVYPYSEDHSINDGIITVSLTDSQPATADGFGHGVNLSAASSSSTDLQFRNVGALVGFTMGNDDIKSVVLTATEENQYLAGKSTLKFTDGLPEVTVTEGSASVRLNGDFEKGKTYYFVVYPGSYTNLEITYVDADGKFGSKKNPNTLNLDRNGNATFGTMTMEFVEFNSGDALFIGGEGAEAGQQFTYINDGYYNTSLSTYGDNFSMDMPYYEIHTQLKAGKDYYFYGLEGDKPLYVSAPAQVAEDGLYRIRINTTTGETVAKKIHRFYFLHLSMKYQVDFDYLGNGKWSKNFKMVVDNENGTWNDDRYKFVLEFADGSIQHYGANHNDDTRYDSPETASEGYFDVQMTATSEWDGKFKITNGYHRKWATVTVYLNKEKDHYTHEFSNKTDVNPAMPEFTAGNPLYIGGEGAEEGQQFTYINADYYNTSLSTYGDNFSMEMPYYEIHTQLKAGKDYYFYDLDGKVSSAAQVAAEGLYRIRINATTREVVTKKIEKFYFLHLDMKYEVDFEYIGKGVWSKNFMMQVDDENGWRDDRYKFVLKFVDGSIQHYGANHNDDTRYDNPESAPEGYFDIQMTATSEWDGKFKLTTDYHRQNATITVYLNNDKGHYTHAFAK